MRFYLLILIPLMLSFNTQANDGGGLPELNYVINKGQWPKQIEYRVDLQGGMLYLEKDRLTFSFLDKDHFHQFRKDNKSDSLTSEERSTAQAVDPEPPVINGHAYQAKWIGANANVQLKGRAKQSHYVNFIKGNDESKWQSFIPVFRNVYYEELYDHIDFSIYSQGSILKSDYILKPGGKVGDIRLKYEGVDDIRINDEGHLIIITSINEIIEHKPYAYQETESGIVEVPCHYKLVGKTVFFDLPEGYDQSRTLTIDPTLIFSTYSGSPVDNWGSSATFDSRGNMFVGGVAMGRNYPTTLGSFQTQFGGGSGLVETDLVVSKFSSDGSQLIFSTFIGGNSNELMSSLFCTPEDELVILSTTSSTNFPTTGNAFQRTLRGSGAVFMLNESIWMPNGTDIAITKLNRQGSELEASTLFGGMGNEGVNLHFRLSHNYGDDSRGDIAVDNQGFIYVVSNTTSPTLPRVVGNAQPNFGGQQDAFVVKFNASLSSAVWATYFGGTGADAGYGIDLDGGNNVIICGGTVNAGLAPLQGGLINNFQGGKADGYVLKIRSDGRTFTAGTYLGTGAYDQAYMIETDQSENVYIFGQTEGNYPIVGNVYFNRNATQFIHKLNPDLNTTLFSTTFGSPNTNLVNISPTAFLVDVCENIYAVGWGGRTNLEGTGNTNNMPVTTDAFQSLTNGSNFYLINLSADAESLIYATYFGEIDGQGDHVDGGMSRFDKNGIVYQATCASCGGTNNFPTTPNAWRRNNGSSNCNMAGFKFRFEMPGLQIITAGGEPEIGCAPFQTTFSYESTRDPISVSWDFGDGTTSDQEEPQHTYNTPGTYEVQLIIEDPSNCNPSDTAVFTIVVREDPFEDLEKNVCVGDSIQVGNQFFSEPGDYEVIIPLPDGCDSTVQFQLIQRPTYEVDTTIFFCIDDGIVIGENFFETPGAFEVDLVSSFGCDSTVFVQLEKYPDFTPEITGEDFICIGDSTELSLDPSLGTVEWSTGEIAPSIFAGAATTYQVTVTDNNGCMKFTDFNLDYFPENPVNTGFDQFLACLQVDVELGVENPPEGEYLWSGPDISPEEATSPNPSVSVEGVYFLEFTSTFGCVTVDSVNVTYRRLLFAFDLEAQASCEGEADGSINVNEITGGIPPYDIVFEGESFSNPEEGVFTDLAAGEYRIFVTDQGDCFLDTIVTIIQAPLIEVDLGPDVIVRLGNSHTIIPEFNDLASGIDSFYWEPPIWLDCDDCIEPTSTPEDSILYTLTLIDNNGCEVTSQIFLRVYQPGNIFVPNAFTPNGDGLNDVFMVFTDPSVSRIQEIKIWDRWGSIMYEAFDFPPNDPLFGWDGILRGTRLNPGVFVFYLIAEYIDGTTELIKGDVLLYR